MQGNLKSAAAPGSNPKPLIAGKTDTSFECIKVSHHKSLYITDDFIVTHNTALAGTISDNLSHDQVKHLYLALEMGADGIHERKLVR